MKKKLTKNEYLDSLDPDNVSMNGNLTASEISNIFWQWN